MFGGMITSTFLAVLFVPVFYVVFQGLGERRAERLVKVREIAERRTGTTSQRRD